MFILYAIDNTGWILETFGQFNSKIEAIAEKTMLPTGEYYRGISYQVDSIEEFNKKIAEQSLYCD